MKRLIGLVLVLCVVAPASFGSILADYVWTGTVGNFTDLTWSCAQTGTTNVVPVESTSTDTSYTYYGRPEVLAATAEVTINTNLAPTNLGFQQMQIDKGKVIIDAGGKLKIHDGYMTAGAKNTTAGLGLFVQNGGQYINTANGAGNQAGTLLNYSTAGAMAAVTISGSGTLFDTYWLYGKRYTQTQVNSALFSVVGSGSTINVGTANPGGNNLTMTYRFTSDVAGVSAINIATAVSFVQGSGNASYTNNKSILDFVLGVAPTPSQSYVLFDLASGATKTGNLMDKWGNVLYEGTGVMSWFGDTQYVFRLTYKGGATGNDIVLTEVPEPATIGLLSLGALALVRRRRA